MGKNALKNKPKLKLGRKLLIIAIIGGGTATLGYFIFTLLGFSLWPKDSYAAPLITIPGDYMLAADNPIGPGGIGHDSSNPFWYDADQLDMNDGDIVQTWSNEGGSNKNAIANSTSRRPVYFDTGAHTINGHPALSFDGVNDYMKITNNTDLNIGGSWTERTFSMAFRTSDDVSSRQFLYEEGAGIRGFNMYIYQENLYFGAWNIADGSPWGFLYETKAITAHTEYIITMVYAGNDSNTGTIECYLNEELIGTMTGVGRMYSHSGDINIGRTGNSYIETGTIAATAYFKGDIAEFIIYNYDLNDAERIVVHNYLSSKYDISLFQNDFYHNDLAGNETYYHDVAGLGRIDTNRLYLDSRGTGIIRMVNSSDLDDGEFLIWGHDDETTNTSNTSDIPVGVSSRMERVWSVTEVDTTLSATDVGEVDIIVDLNNLFSSNPTEVILLVDTDGDESFADETPIDGLLTNTTNIYVFQHVDELEDGAQFTIGIPNGVFLPIELAEFEVECLDEQVEVTWTTASQSNNDYFTIERSHDGETYVEIGEEDGAGSSSIEMDYTFIDYNPLPGISYYRLKQTDFNGDFEIFDPVSVVNEVKMEEFSIVSVGPNPFSEQFTAKYSTQSLADVEISLVNINGLVLSKEIVSPYQGVNEYSYSEGSSLEPGIYILNFIQGQEQKSSVKLIKK